MSDALAKARRMLAPAPQRPELDALMAAARGHKMTAAEINAQRRSWVRGQMGLSHPEMTTTEIDAILDEVIPPLAPVPDLGKVKEALRTYRPRINCIIAAIETGNAEVALIWLRSLAEGHDAALATLEQTDG